MKVRVGGARHLDGISTWPRNSRRLGIAFFLLLVLIGSASAQTPSPTAPKSEFIAPGVEHIQMTRGYKSDKDTAGPRFINILRIDLTKARLRMVHALDEEVGLET